MARHVRLREFLVGVEGLALLRGLFGPAEVAMQQPAAAYLPRATQAAYLDVPGALVWDLAKDG